MVEAEDLTAAAAFMEAGEDGRLAVGEVSAVDAGLAEAARMAAGCNAAELGDHMVAECNAAADGDLAGIRVADIADMGERDMAEEGSMAGLALRDEVSAAMRGDFPMRGRR